MSLEQRVRAYRRSARYRFYSMQAEGTCLPGITNWRMIIAAKFGIPVRKVREILGEPS